MDPQGLTGAKGLPTERSVPRADHPDASPPTSPRPSKAANPWWRSLRVRITALACLALLVLVVVVGLALSRTLEQQLVKSVDNGLIADLDGVGDEQTNTLPRGFPNRGGRTGGGPLGRRLELGVATSPAALRLYSETGEVLVSSNKLSRINLDFDPLMATSKFLSVRGQVVFDADAGEFAADDGSGDLRVARRQLDSGRTLIAVGSLSSVEESLDGFGRRLLLGAPVLLVLLGALVWFFTGRALSPVESIRQEVDGIDGDDLGRRISVPGSSYELSRLATTMNGMLSRVDESVAGQRRFVADASHELRSPLAGIRSTLEVNLAHPEGVDWEESGVSMQREATRMQRLIEDLLELAHSDAGETALRHEAVDLDDVVLDTVSAQQATHPSITFDLSAVSAAQVHGDREALARVIRNLTENAARHARSTVWVGTREHGGYGEFLIADDGPGIPEHQKDEVFERFARLDEARSRDAGGSGLGLAIARDIVVRHNGDIALSRSNAGGAEFVVRLPI